MSVIQFTCNGTFYNIVMPPHAKAHEWINGKRNDDAVSFHPRMFAYLRTTTIEDSVIVNTTPLVYRSGSSFSTFTGEKTNLTSYIPGTTNYARLVLIGLNTDTNELEVISGTQGLDSAESPLPIPTGMDDNFIPSALIKLKYGDVSLTEDRITDARIFLSTSGNHSHSSLKASDGSPNPAWSVDSSGNLTNPGNGVLDLNGINDALVLDADQDTSISSPTDDQIDFEAGGVDIARITDAGLLLPQTGDDVYIAGDEAGVKQRLVNFNHASITDHFSAFSGWTWASYTGFGTPATIDVSSIADHAQIYNNTNQKSFAYQTFTFSTVVDLYARLYPGEQGYYGLRLDDGSNSNFCQIVGQFTSFKVTIYKYYAIGGVVTGPTALVADLPHGYFHFQLRRTAALALWFYSTNAYTPQFLAFDSMSWTPTRWGLYLENTNSTTNLGHSLTIDWVRKV